MKDRAVECDYATHCNSNCQVDYELHKVYDPSRIKVVTAMKPSPTLRPSFDLVGIVDQLCDEYGISTPFSYLQILT